MKKINSKHKDLASSVQVVFEEALLNLLQWAKKNYPDIENLFISGGCALNVSANGIILKSHYLKIYQYHLHHMMQVAQLELQFLHLKKLNLEKNIDDEYKKPFIWEKI